MWRGILSCFRQAVNARARKDGEGCAACRSELFRSEIARPHTGGPRLSRPCPLGAHPLHPRPGARSTRADTPHADPNCSEAKSRGPTREGRACRGRAPWSQHVVTGPCTRSTRAAHDVGRRRAPRTESRPTAPRAGGGAGTSRADTPHADPNCSEAKSRAPTREGHTPARPGGPSAASATARRTRGAPARGGSGNTPPPPTATDADGAQVPYVPHGDSRATTKPPLPAPPQASSSANTSTKEVRAEHPQRRARAPDMPPPSPAQRQKPCGH